MATAAAVLGFLALWPAPQYHYYSRQGGVTIMKREGKPAVMYIDALKLKLQVRGWMDRSNAIDENRLSPSTTTFNNTPRPHQPTTPSNESIRSGSSPPSPTAS